MLALRSVLVVPGGDEEAGDAAACSPADAVLFDLASPGVHGRRRESRERVARSVERAGAAGRVTLVRVNHPRTRELAADVDATVSGALAGIVLPGVEAPQDVRDADVAIRKREMRAGIRPGSVRLISEIDSPAGLRQLPRILEAVDRHAAVAVDVDGMRRHMRLGTRATAVHDHAMASVMLAAGTAGLPWIVTGFDPRQGSGTIATRAHDFGAAGVEVGSDAEARGMNALFTPDAAEIDTARELLRRWQAARGRGRWVEQVETPAGERVIDLREVRYARALVELADAIRHREAAR